ncbi:MAG: slipin family protein [Gemmatimonadetes bacterium]|nr:slipin family protein [Gemmatimonadota bacterium]
MIEILIPVGLASIIMLWTSLRVLREYERGVIFRLGRLIGGKGPGLIFLVPLGIDRMVKVSLRIVALDIPPQDVITRDNVSVKVNAVLYFRVGQPVKAICEIEDYLFATSQLAQTTLRSVIGQAELDQLLAEREHFNQILRQIIDEGTDPWGIEVTAVEVKDIDLPQEMKRAMARQAEAERERRAKVIAAAGEFQAAGKLAEAANVISSAPGALQLRYLQTVVEIAAENNSTTLFPIPMELLPLLETAGRAAGAAPGRASRATSGEPAAEPALPPPASLGTELDPRKSERGREPVRPR